MIEKRPVLSGISDPRDIWVGMFGVVQDLDNISCGLCTLPDWPFKLAQSRTVLPKFHTARIALAFEVANPKRHPKTPGCGAYTPPVSVQCSHLFQ
jgi:hypothetical protein